MVRSCKGKERSERLVYQTELVISVQVQDKTGVETSSKVGTQTVQLGNVRRKATLMSYGQWQDQPEEPENRPGPILHVSTSR